MKCPLIIAGWNATRGGDKAFEGNCLEEECAWWDEMESKCSVLSGFQTFEDIKRSIQVIENVMPRGN